MFSTERSDFGSTIIGYFLSAIVLLFGGLTLMNLQFDWFPYTEYTPFSILTLLLICASAIALWKAYIIDGITFMVVGLTSYAFATSNEHVFLIVVVIAAAATAFMSIRVGDVFVCGVNVTLGIASLIGALSVNVDFFVDNPVISAIFLVISGVIAGYLCISDWMLVQDISMDYEDEMFGDDCCDDEGCSCGCHDGECQCGDDCDCGDDCECHKDSEECQAEENKQ